MGAAQKGIRTMTRQVIAGQDVASIVKSEYDAMHARRAADPRRASREDFANLQTALSQRGFVEAELVESRYGWSVRYASGLQNFGLISAARDRADRSYEAAVAIAQAWVAVDPSRRWATAPALQTTEG